MKIVVTAGPTREKIDPVRFITNLSSGKMGYAIAAAARDAGHETVLISGPVAISAPAGVRVINVESAQDMFEAVSAEFPQCDMLIMCAAVADYRPKYPAAGKMKKAPGDLTLELERTPDILKTMGERKQPHQILVGFAAETDNLEAYAKGKLVSKNLDFIAANLASDGFGSDSNKITLYKRDMSCETMGPASKDRIAGKLISAVTSKA